MARRGVVAICGQITGWWCGVPSSADQRGPDEDGRQGQEGQSQDRFGHGRRPPLDAQEDVGQGLLQPLDVRDFHTEDGQVIDLKRDWGPTARDIAAQIAAEKAAEAAHKAGKSVDEAAANTSWIGKYQGYESVRVKAAVQTIYDELSGK